MKGGLNKLQQTRLSAQQAPVQLEGEHVRAGSYSSRYGAFAEPAARGELEDTAARDEVVRRPVIVRRLSSGARADASARRRFLRAARLQAQLEHPAIVAVYDMGIDPEGAEYMTLPPTRGVTLREVLDGMKKSDSGIASAFGRGQLLQSFLKLCLAVDYAHARGALHRKLEPEGIVLREHGEVYLVDWSLAKTESGSSVHENKNLQTAPGQLLGSPGYAAPEQLAGDDVDARADIYALGAILFEILAGSPLHQGATTAERARSTHLGTSALPSQRAPEAGILAAFDEVCVRATARDPKFRYRSARDLHDAVERIVQADQDAEKRVDLAARFAERAESAAMRALVAESDSIELRRNALQEAGRAFALDPNSPGARRALLTLLKEEPKKLPPEAAEQVEREEANQARAVGRFGVMAYTAFVALLTLAVFSGIRSWVGFFIIVAPLLVTIATCVWLSRIERPTPGAALLLAASSFTAIACASGLYGALIMVPALAVANTLALNMGILRERRIWVLLMGMAAIGVPVVFERLGWIPHSYDLTASVLAVLPVVREFPETPTRLGLLLVSLAAVIAPTVFTYRMTDALDHTRERMQLYTWQLRQLLPRDTRASLYSEGASDEPMSSRKEPA